MTTCCRRAGSPEMGEEIGARTTSRVMPFAPAVGRAESTDARTSAGRSSAAISRSSLPETMRETSRRSAISVFCTFRLRSMVSTARWIRAGSVCPSLRMCTQPTIAVSGVRSSWERVAKKMSFIRAASSSSLLATESSSSRSRSSVFARTTSSNVPSRSRRICSRFAWTWIVLPLKTASTPRKPGSSSRRRRGVGATSLRPRWARCGEQRAQPRDEGVGLVGLADEAVRAHLEGLHDLLGLAQRRDQHHRDLAQRGVGLDRPAQLEAGEARHEDVAHDQIEGRRRQSRERRLPVPGHVHREAFALQDQTEQPGLGRAVFDDEDAWRAHRVATFRRRCRRGRRARPAIAAHTSSRGRMKSARPARTAAPGMP